MKQTVVAVFEKPLLANEALHVLVQSRFDAERLPRIRREHAATRKGATGRLWLAMRRRFEDFMDADMYLQPYACALAKGRFVIKVYVADDAEALGAKRILDLAGGKEIDFLADEWVEASGRKSAVK